MLYFLNQVPDLAGCQEGKFMNCEFWDKCTFYDDYISKMPVTAIFYKKQYCDLDFVTCARNMIAAKLGHEQVPHDLFPCQDVRARRIIEGIIQVSAGSLSNTSVTNEVSHKNDRNSYLSREGTTSEKKAMQLLKQYNGDKVVALGAYYAEVRRKHPGYIFTNELKPDDEFYDAHKEYIAIRNLIHTLAEKAPANQKPFK